MSHAAIMTYWHVVVNNNINAYGYVNESKD